MSATNRGGLARHEFDFYETPSEAIDVVLDALEIGPTYDGYVIDCGTGTGAIASAVARRAPLADVTGIELQPELLDVARAARAVSVGWELADWLTWEPDGQPDLVIGNPPYQLTHWDPELVVMKKGKPTGEIGGIVIDDAHFAEKFIRKALAVAGKRGTVAMLLRANYLVPKTRRALRREFGKPDVLALEKRPSFNGSGTDATDYAWYVWGPKRLGRFDVLEVQS
jgi:methylase of polypeptide subunit release factors